jgi:hypothetical protein
MVLDVAGSAGDIPTEHVTQAYTMEDAKVGLVGAREYPRLSPHLGSESVFFRVKRQVIRPRYLCYNPTHMLSTFRGGRRFKKLLVGNANNPMLSLDVAAKRSKLLRGYGCVCMVVGGPSQKTCSSPIVSRGPSVGSVPSCFGMSRGRRHAYAIVFV